MRIVKSVSRIKILQFTLEQFIVLLIGILRFKGTSVNAIAVSRESIRMANECIARAATA